LYWIQVLLRIDAFMDLDVMKEVRNAYENVGAVILGGGVPKNYVFQSFYLSKRNLRYGIQITLDRPETGGFIYIPQTEITRSEGGLVEQTPGWEY